MSDRLSWLRPILDVGASVYGAAVDLRKKAYDKGVLTTERPTVPVISVGNLAVGGIGKTPFVILLANRLKCRVAVLSRGYGRSDEDALIVVSDGSGPRVPAEIGGDEPVLIAKRTRAAVVACADRALAAEAAVEKLGAEVLLLDDGFQHLRLVRDLNVVLLDKAAPFSDGRLLPSGHLREKPSALERADLIVLVGEGDRPEVTLPDRPIVEVAVRPIAVEEAGEERAPSSLAGRRVALLCGIGRPARFRATVEALGAEVVFEERVRDHASISDRELVRFVGIAEDRDAEVLLTTEKDAVRLGARRPAELASLSIAHEITEGEDRLDAAIARTLA